MAEPEYPNRNHGLKLLLGLIVLGALAIAAVQFNLPASLQPALMWMKGVGPIGAIAFIGLYGLAIVLFIPASVLTLGGGAVFGVLWGTLYVFFGAMLGATIAFLVGRYLARSWVAQRIENNAKFAAIDAAVAKEGLKIVLLTRLSPVFPFTLLNYAFSLTQVSLKDFVLGSIGMLPGTVMYVYLGSLAGDLAFLGTETVNPDAQRWQWAIRGIGFIATVAVTVYITRIARHALAQRLEES